jgi:D-amino peptidase
MKRIVSTVVLLFTVVTVWPQARKTVFIITDAEGVAGICRQAQVEPQNAELRQLLSGEVNAAVEGFLAGGADEVIVWDGHDGSQTLSLGALHPRAKLMQGSLPVGMSLERGYSAVAFVGQHSLAGVKAGIMAHSYSSLGIQNMRLNGKPVGEIETRTALAGWFNIPVIFLSGDQAAVQELLRIVPAAETAAVKEGLGRYTCLSLSAQAARDLIRDRATAAMQKLDQIRPYRIEGPVTIEYEYTTRNSLPADAGLRPGAQVVDDRTIRYLGKDFWEAWTRSQVR